MNANGPREIAVVMATSNGRTNLLDYRSLKSVYLQKDINPVEVVIVDDNPIPEGEDVSVEYAKIKEVMEKLRKEILLDTHENLSEKKTLPFENFFRTTLLKNNRTSGHSGTGAWNTAIYCLAERYEPESIFVAILDDDDEYRPEYLRTCREVLRRNPNAVAVFPHVEWVEKNMVLAFTKEDLTPRNFFVGNPGIQGSNMCIRLDILVNIGGFDEELYSATDRDLMIQLLNYLKEKKDVEIEIIPEVMVLHHTDSPNRVTANRTMKKLGLDVFYKKWKSHFSEEDFQKSLERARRLFGYEYEGER